MKHLGKLAVNLFIPAFLALIFVADTVTVCSGWCRGGGSVLFLHGSWLGSVSTFSLSPVVTCDLILSAVHTGHAGHMTD